MAAHSFSDLLPHVGHEIMCVTYGRYEAEPIGVALECETCGVVLLDFDNDTEAPEEDADGGSQDDVDYDDQGPYQGGNDD